MKISCPHCGQRYEVDDSFAGQSVTCERCWKDFVAFAPEPPPEPPAPPKPEVKPALKEDENQEARIGSPMLCPYCKSTILVTAKKCRYCGEWLIERKEPKNPVVFVLLAIFGGVWGTHSFYVGDNLLAGAHIAMTIFAGVFVLLDFGEELRGKGALFIAGLIAILHYIFILVELADCDEQVKGKTLKK